jgi:hypothetical protein
LAHCVVGGEDAATWLAESGWGSPPPGLQVRGRSRRVSSRTGGRARHLGWAVRPAVGIAEGALTCRHPRSLNRE